MNVGGRVEYSGARWRENPQRVVPANAGTHTPQPIIVTLEVDAF
jgi:hypothetical protein